jgi:hypothetical protein
MSDDKTKKSKGDDIRVDINDPNEVEYLHRQFPGKEHSEIVEAIKAAGPYREKIVLYLQGKA